MKKSNLRIQQIKVADWNRLHPNPGVKVFVLRDDGTTLETVTRSAAWMLGGHSAVIMVEGIAGAYSLDRVTTIRL